MAARKVVAEDGIEAARMRFEQWRKTRTRKAPIPDELWTVAISTARQAGVNRTAQQLRLDAGKLKRLLMAAGGGSSNTPRKPKFVELIAPMPSALTPECVIEFESACGGKMRVHWKSPSAPDWTSLLRAWRDVGR
jgi:hypothetical protein